MKRIAFIAMLLTLCAAISYPADAAPVTLKKSDTAKYWTGWGNGTGDDGKDVIGTPDITNTGVMFTDAIEATFELDANKEYAYLSQVLFNYNLNTTFFSLLQLGDLFIDDGQNGQWDWVIRASDIDKGIATAGGGTAVNVYHFQVNPIAVGSRAGLGTPINYDTGLDGDGNKWDYVLSGKDNTNLDKNAGANDNSTGTTTSGNNTGVNWKGYHIRDDHPWAVSHSRLQDPTAVQHANDATVSGWTGAANDKLTFDIATLAGNPLPGVKLALTQVGNVVTTAFRIGFAFNCANDVIFENFTYSRQISEEIPEPSTLLLLGTGLVGLVAYRRKRA